MDNAALPGREAERKRRAREQRKKQRQREEYMQRATIRAALMSEFFPLTSHSDNHEIISILQMQQFIAPDCV